MTDLFLFKSALKETLRPRRLLLALFLVLFPAMIASLYRFMNAEQFDPFDAYNNASSTMVFGFILVILAVVYGTGVISQEVEQKTIVYLLTRPVPRWRILLMKYLAAVCSITATVWLASLILAFAAFGFGDSERSFLLRSSEIQDVPALVAILNNPDDDVATYLVNHLSDRAKRDLNPEKFSNSQGSNRRDRIRRQVMLSAQPVRRLSRALREINDQLLSDRGFYSEERFGLIMLTDATKKLVEEKPSGKQLAHLNRLLLQQYYPQIIMAREPPVFPLWTDIAVLPVGAFAYGALFLLLATVLNRPMMYGLVFAFGWESWVPNIPGKFQYLSIMTYVRALAPHPKMGQESGGFLQFMSGTVANDPLSKTTAMMALVGTVVVCLGMAFIIFSNNEYVPREDAE